MLGYDSEVSCELYPTTLPSALSNYGDYETFISGKDHFGVHDIDDDGDARFVSHGYQHLKLYDGLTEEEDHYDEWFASETGGADPMATGNLTWNAWQGAPYVYEENLHPTSWTSDEALNFLSDFDFSDSNDKKMFLKASFHRPHSPYDPPKRLYDKDVNAPDDGRYARNVNSGSWDDAYFVDNENGTAMAKEAWHGDPGEDAARLSRAAYLASVEFVDENIGKLLDWISDSGLDDDFLVIWVADHGDMNGDHNLWRKGYPWEESAHVPLVIRPDATTRTTSTPVSVDSVVEIRDVAPTIWDAAGILPSVLLSDPQVDGSSLLPILSGTSTSVREWLDLEHNPVYNATVHWNAIVSDTGMKYVFNAFDGSENLFNLTADPSEADDLAMRQEWQGEVAKWRGVMVGQFEAEGRGEDWVKDGELQLRKTGELTHSPNFPCL